MMFGLKSRYCIVLSVALVTQGGAVKATPIEKVITLLKDLSEKLAAEGQKEAVAYDKYACFCKEQADAKQYAIEKSEKKVDYLKAEIAELQTAKSELEGEMQVLKRKIHKKDDKIGEKSDIRSDEHKEYLGDAKDMNEAISACKRAIDAMKNSKQSMKGAKLDLTQVTSGLVKVVQSKPLLTAAPGAMALLSKLDEKGAPKFQYHSNDIIATLEDLLQTFEKAKKRADYDEFNSNAAFERVRLGLENEIKFADKSLQDKAQIVNNKEEAIAEATDRKQSEEADMASDEKFNKRLSYECREKAELFDQRSQVRANELSTLGEATSALQSGAAGNYGANKKLVGLQQATKAAVGRVAEPPSTPVSFVQISNTQSQEKRDEAALERVRSFLDDVADRSGSGPLSSLAVRVGLTATRGSSYAQLKANHRTSHVDRYDKVRTLIQNLLDKLRADELSEHDQKSDCDEGISKATSDRDTAKARIEVANGKLTALNANKDSLEASNEVLSKQISGLKKAINEATELTTEQVANLDEQISMCDEGEKAVAFALSLLEPFYKKNSPEAFLQADPTPPPKFTTSRDGETVGDLDPGASFDSTYHGAQAESKGIIAILQVILNDFQESGKQAEKDKKTANADLKMINGEANESVGKKTKERDVKNSAALVSVNGNIQSQDQELMDANSLLESALKALDGWHTMCVKAEETWDERRQKRQEEIDALKEALTILEEWQK